MSPSISNPWENCVTSLAKPHSVFTRYIQLLLSSTSDSIWYSNCHVTPDGAASRPSLIPNGSGGNHAAANGGAQSNRGLDRRDQRNRQEKAAKPPQPAGPSSVLYDHSLPPFFIASIIVANWSRHVIQDGGSKLTSRQRSTIIYSIGISTANNAMDT